MRLGLGVQGTMNAGNGDILEAALDYLQRGWSVIRIHPGTKKAAGRWGKYQKRRPTQAELGSWFGNGRGFGLAVVLGAISGDLVVRDFDNATSYEAWATAFPDLARTLPTVATSRGRHVYFRAADLKSRAVGDGEYRANGNYVLLPPSRHPSGAVYRWLVSPPDGELPLVDPVELGLLPQVPRVEPAPPQPSVAAPVKGGLPQLSQRTHRFLKTGAAEGHRNHELFYAACDMAACGISRPEAERKLLDACVRCQPPYPPEEAVPTIASAYSRPRQPAKTTDDPWGCYVIPRCIAQRTDITEADKLLWSDLDYRQRDKMECFPGVDTLAKDIGINRDTVSQGVKRLKRARLLTVWRIGRSNHYTTHLPEIPSVVSATTTGSPPAGKTGSNDHESKGVDCGSDTSESK